MLKRLLGIIISLSFLFLISTCCYAQPPTDKIDKYIEAAMAERQIPGLALAVIQDGVPIKVKGYGLADIELNVPVKPETIFQSGSVGKQFTATAIVQLAEDGKLNLDDKISRYFQNSPPAWQTITIRNLLTHISGIPEYGEDPTGIKTGINFQKNYTEDELLKKAMAMPLDFQPGEKWSYSNTGYVLLGILIHKVTGKFYGDILQERIFQPLSMETARIINEADIIPNRAAGYELKNGEWRNQSWVSPSLNTTADGSLYFTILDLIKWDAALTKEKIVSRTSFQEMVIPVRLNSGSSYPYGFGWRVSPVNGHKAYQHSGIWQGFNANIARFPDDKITVIILTNLNPSNPGIIARDVAALYVPELARTVYKPITDRNPQLTNFVGNLYKNPDALDLNDKLLEYREKIKTIAQTNMRLLKTFGAVQSVEPVERKKDGDSILIRYRIKYKVGSLLVSITMNKSGRITDITSEAE